MRFLIALALILVASTALAKAPKLPKAGEYQCRISKEYKFRPCTISHSDKGAQITIPNALITLEGNLHPIKGGLYFDGKLSGKRSFGCHSCAEECSQPGRKCGCSEIPQAGLTECMAQPMSALLKKSGKGWSGRIAQRMYEVVYAKLKPGQKPQDRPVIGYEYTIDVHSIDIR